MATPSRGCFSGVIAVPHPLAWPWQRWPAAGWRAFYDANGGAIPIECQAGRAAMGLAAEETRLVRIGEGEEDVRMAGTPPKDRAFQHWGYPKNAWFIVENPIKMWKCP